MPRSRGRTGRPWRRTRQRIIRRDSICYLCGQPLDPALQYPHPQSTVVDHIEPLSHNDHRALDLTNLAAVHKRCNEIKGNGSPHRVAATRNSRTW